MSAPSLLPNLDVTGRVFHDLRPGTRRRFRVVAFAFETPATSTPQTYIKQTDIQTAHGAKSIFGRWSQRFYAQDPPPIEVRAIPITRTAGRPATDWSEGLTQYVEEYGTDFYRICVETDVPAEQLEVANWAAATGLLDAVRFFGRNWAGSRSTAVIDEGGGNSATLTLRVPGPSGDLFQYEILPSQGNDETLDITATALSNQATKFTVTPATDGGGAITTTLQELVARFNSDPDSSVEVFCELDEGAVGSTVISDTGGVVAFADGGDGADLVLDGDNLPDVSQYVDRVKLAFSDRADFYFHPQPHPFYTEVGGVDGIINGYYPDAVGAAVGAVRNNGSFTYKDRPVQSMTDVTDRALWGAFALNRTAMAALRAGKINTFQFNPIEILRITDGFASSGLYADIREAGDILLTWDIESYHDLLTQPPGGRGKVPFSDPGFSMIQDRAWRNTVRATLPQWNFIQIDPNTNQPAARIRAPRYIDLLATSPELIKLRHYPLVREATYEGAVHEIDITTYLTIEWIPTELTVFQLPN